MLRLLNLSEIGRRLASLDRHLFEVLGTRIGPASLSDFVADAKRAGSEDQVYSIKRPEVEDDRLAMAIAWANEKGIDPNFATSLMFLVIAESCRGQHELMIQHRGDPKLDFSNPQVVWEYHRQQLMDLTAAVAPVYEQRYIKGSFGTRVHNDFERGEIGRIVTRTRDHGLALDLGCASGYMTRFLSRHFSQVIGFDLSPQMIDQANAKLEGFEFAGQVSFKVHDLEEGIPMPDSSVSMILMNMGTASDIRDIKGLVKEMRRVLKPKGQFLLSFYNADSLLAKLGSLPWPMPLSANIDPERKCLDVHIGNKLYVVYAQPYHLGQAKGLFAKNGFIVRDVLTHPTLSSILPESILSLDSIAKDPKSKYGELQGRSRPANLVREEKTEACESIARLDEELARVHTDLGAYITIVGEKE